MEYRVNADDVDHVVKDSSRDGIQEGDFAVEFSSDLQSAPPGSSPYASISLPSASKGTEHDGSDVAHGARANDIKKLEHASSTEPMHLTGIGMVDSIKKKRPPVVLASNYDFSPGAFPVRSASNAATSRTFRSPMSSCGSKREFVYDESKQYDGVPNFSATRSGLYAVEAQPVLDGNEDGTVMVAEAQHLKLKWYQRQWIALGSILCACGLTVVVVVLVVRQPSAASSLTSPTPVPMFGAPTTPVLTKTPPNSTPTSLLPPEAIACNFLSISNMTVCRSTFVFESACGDITTGPTIPSEIGLMTHLTFLDLDSNLLTSTIPSEIGLLTKLRLLRFDHNLLTSTIPSEIGLLTQLTYLDLYGNELRGTIPPSLCSLPSLSDIWIGCGEIACAPGCCNDYSTGSSCGSLTPIAIACNFLSISNVTKCRSTFGFASGYGDTTTGSTIPSEIGLLTQLTYLDLSAESLTSTIPSEIGLLTLLNGLDLFGNSLTSTIPSEIALLTQLTYLRFDINALSSTIPSEIGLMTQLERLDFSYNELKGTIPSSLCALSSPNGYISIDCGEITCASGCCYDGSDGSSCGSLTPVAIACNFLSIPNVTKCRSTFKFDTGADDKTTGSTIPSEIGLLTQLQYLYFGYSSLTSTIPSEIGLLTQLTSLRFDSNSLTSTIPSEIGLLTQLGWLDFSYNLLTSTIPSEIGILTQLGSLFFDSNELTGTIPTPLCSLPFLHGYIHIDCGEITCTSGCCYSC